MTLNIIMILISFKILQIKINNKLEKHISQSGFDNALLSPNKKYVLIKHGVRLNKTQVCERGQLTHFNIFIDIGKGSAVEQFNFVKSNKSSVADLIRFAKYSKSNKSYDELF